ncbi:E3 SUMO-protein ligase ZBED1 [Lepisosteus oculatus]|uniref:E3 SUMO-protein ligase ZBED1 n=1 Tax=Lepisosteus oculatus TaxID=7918 RepID=UPI0037225D49
MEFPGYSLPSGLGPPLKRRGERGAGGPLGRPLYCASVDRRKSKVWNYYTQLSESHVECNVCKKQLSFHNSTTTMREHLVRKHSIRDNGPAPAPAPPAAAAAGNHSLPALLAPPPPAPFLPGPGGAGGGAAALVVVKEETQEAEVSPEGGESKRARLGGSAAGGGGAGAGGGIPAGAPEPEPPSHSLLSGLFYPEAGGGGGGARGCSSKRAGLLTDLILEMVFRDLQPLSLVEERGFRLLLGCLEPQYPAPSPSQLGSLLWHRYHALKQHLEQHLSASLPPRGLTLCAERWRSLGAGGGGGRLYLTVSAHFVDRDWRLARCVLETRPVPELAEGAPEAQLGAALRSVLSEFRLPESAVSSVVHDRCWAPEEQEGRQDREALPAGWAALCCAGEALKLCVQEGLSAEPVRQALAAARAIVSHFQHDARAAAALNPKAGARLVLDEPGRWATALEMCESLLELKWVVSSVLEEQKAPPNLADHQWRLLQELAPVLRTVRIAAAFLSEDANAAVSALMPCLHGVARLLGQRMAESGCAAAQGVMGRVRAQMERRWQLGEEEALLGSPAVLASFLDPRFKELRFLSPDARSKLHNRVKELLSAQSYSEEEERESGRGAGAGEVEREGSGLELGIGLGMGGTLSASTAPPLDSPMSCGSGEESDLIVLQQQQQGGGAQVAMATSPQVTDKPLGLGGAVGGSGRVPSVSGRTSAGKGELPAAPTARDRTSPEPQSMYDLLLGEDPTERMPEIHQQLENYIAEPLCKRSLSPLDWWRAKEHRFPAVARLARQYLAIPATAPPADRAFAPRETPAAQRRATLGPQHLDHILFLHQNCDYLERLRGGAAGRREPAGSSTLAARAAANPQARESLYQSLVSYENRAWLAGEEP